MVKYIRVIFINSKFDLYAKLLIEWNEKFNLTAITEPSEIAAKHFKDSLYCSDFIPKNAHVADVGSGAGFPGIPLKIARPDITLTLFDALAKRVNFLKHLCERLEIDADCVHIRAEDAGKDKIYREQFDVAVSRAVAKMPVLAEYCLPLVRVGGSMLSMKGNSADDEVASAAELISALGGGASAINYYIIEGTDIKHSIVKIEKKAPTPSSFPRRANKIGLAHN